ncbi:hypothetical protein GS16_05685 [Candidatus Liberibacter solanacearum]|uniref:hypothetical protein n=1 Tax=Candidatus Liberibacter solanacearum TaxID=556287 RepID=UPI0005085F25|nr:hypothetical protein [Candidatus Liberibacter solanacearum]KGB27158.1 hypothetical protein GS16_05685 [Candidatus Liberibacter solanacearum]
MTGDFATTAIIRWIERTIVMKISKYKIILLSLMSLPLASCGSTTDVAPLPANHHTNHHISVVEAATKTVKAAKKVVSDAIDDLVGG